MADTPDLGKLWKQLTDNVGGGVSEALDKLKKSSIGEQVQSWIGKGENKPVNADQVTQAIGQDQMEQIAQQAGTTPEQAAQAMADKLPGMVDKMTPDGQLPNPQSIKDNVAGAQNTTTTATAMGTAATGQATPRPEA
uniref:YidB family protein n=2 Tax=Catenulispora pinisilvae TaxID=2705253 RepID=UPI0018926D21